MKRILLTLMFTMVGNAFAEKAVVAYQSSDCYNYYIGASNSGFFIFQWYGGYTPTKNDKLVGKIDSYGLQTVYYPNSDVEGRVYIEDYGLSKESALERYYDKCH